MKTKKDLIFSYQEIQHVYQLGKLEGLFSIHQNSNNRKDVNFNKFIEEKFILENTIETVQTEM